MFLGVKRGLFVWKYSLFEDFVVFGVFFGANLLGENRVLLGAWTRRTFFWFWLGFGFGFGLVGKGRLRIKRIKAPLEVVFEILV